MALTETAQPQKMLDKTMASLAAGVSIVLLTTAMAITIVYLALHTDAPTWLWVMGLGKIVVQCLLIVTAVRLLRGSHWAQQVLLVLWTLVMADAFILLLGLLMWGPPAWWNDLVGWPVGAIAGPALGCSAAAVVLLILSARGSSRLRYSSMVIVSIVVALVAVVVINMIAQDGDNYVRMDAATLERYGISDRTRKILASLDKGNDKKLRLTCVYTSEAVGKESDKYRPRVLELLGDIEDAVRKNGGQAEVANVTTVAQKALLDARLREKQFADQADHVALLKDFLTQSKTFSADMKAQEKRWSSLGADSYLDMWNLGADVGGICKKRAQKIDEVVARIAPQFAGSGLPDCGALASDVKGLLKDVQEGLARASGYVDTIRDIPAAIARNRGAATAALTEAADALEAAAKTVHAPKAPETSTAPATPAATEQDPAKVLTGFAAAAHNAAEKIRAAAVAMADLAGESNSPVLRASTVFSYEQEMMTPVGPMVARRNLVKGLLEDTAMPLDDLASQAEAIVKNAKSEFQAQLIPEVRQRLAQYTAALAMIRDRSGAAMEALVKVDPTSQSIFDEAAGGKLFGAIAAPLEKLLARIDALPEIKPSSLTQDTAGENIIVVEVGDEMKVATFNQVWPRQGGQMASAEDSEDVKRKFNGDAAIGSKILAMSHKPFATVLLTYYQQKVPPQMANQMPQMPSPLPPQMLQTLKAALVDARFEVKEWNLADESEPQIDKDASKILIVLPEPPKSPMAMMGSPELMPLFGPAEMDKIRHEIDSGTPAVFMAMYMEDDLRTRFGSMPAPNYTHMGKYLRDEWGIDVHHTYLMIKGIANVNRNEPGTFKLDLNGIKYLPISTFTEHAIGAPLRGQQVFWGGTCPVGRTGDAVPGVKIESVLTVPAGVTNIWASKDIERVGRLFVTGEPIRMNPEAGDMVAPMDLAVAATRAGDEEAKRGGARVVVMGMGYSMTDEYVNTPRLVTDNTGASVEDPPRANLDMVVNSVYWLSGRQQFIAAGPARLKPIAAIGEGQMQTLRIICLGVLPLIVAMVGGLVLYARKH